jgi:hypothetical protein
MDKVPASAIELVTAPSKLRKLIESQDKYSPVVYAEHRFEPRSVILGRCPRRHHNVAFFRGPLVIFGSQMGVGDVRKQPPSVRKPIPGTFVARPDFVMDSLEGSLDKFRASAAKDKIGRLPV